MKKTVLLLGLVFLFVSTSAFEFHKFYVSITQVQFVPAKKRVEITSRIFLDDLNKVLEKKYQKKILTNTNTTTNEEQLILKKYLNDHFKIKINGQQKPLQYHASELEEDVVVVYLSIQEVKSIQSFEIQNSVLMDFTAEQQNIMHFTANGAKKSLNFTENSKVQMLKY